MRKLLILFGLLLMLSNCADTDSATSSSNKPAESSTAKNTNSKNVQIYSSVSSSSSGIRFNNQLTETANLNPITHDGMLQGAGVGILDYDNDGLQDIYFASNMESDRLYRNLGNFKFEDVTKSSGIVAENWSTGIAVVDINNDGYDDVYVCKFMYDDEKRRHNKLYINQKNGQFKDMAKAYGIDDTGHSIMANFFDYDRDGDLDLYVANQPPNSLQQKGILKGRVDYKYTDKLYRNDGNRFTNVTNASGIKNSCYSLSATTIDFNKDGWPDLYVAADYYEADLFYKNNGNGTFTNVANTSLKHISNFSMGADVADVNNDGQLDIFVADMVAEDNFRQKTNMSGMDTEQFYAITQSGHHYQYMFNTLQLNNGDNSFSEIAQLSGISNTDWSWSPLFIDMDQDGYRDLYITNGIIKEMRNQDYIRWRKEYYNQQKNAARAAGKPLRIDPLNVTKAAEQIKITNYVYQNNGDLTFAKQNSSWGLNDKTWSQGAAYADFDNDGDLDLVINNMHMEASLYKNNAVEKGLNNFISMTLEGPARNQDAINAQIEINYNGTTQVYEYTPYRGYMSSSHKIAHFGLGSNEVIDNIKIVWHDNKMNQLTNVKANQILNISYANATGTYKRVGQQKSDMFNQLKGINVTHEENKYDDFKREILLPYKTSTLGPITCQGDVNNDGLPDLFVGGSFGRKSKILINQNNNNFKAIEALSDDVNFEDGGATFIDIDNDKDLDLYVASGGNEFKAGDSHYQDRLYLNNGQGAFTPIGALPNMTTSNSVVIPMDYDNDGDNDLFVGGRQVPGKYGRATHSYILQNNNGKFTNVTNQVAPMFSNFGMVTDAKLVDLDNDNKKELVIVGEWMPVSVFSIGVQFKDVSSNYGLKQTNGWWNTVEIEDIDKDGDKDIIAGNLGHNIKYKANKDQPFKVYADDFDSNGSNDVYLGYYEGGKCYPVRGRQCSSEQMPFVKDKFGSYKEFGMATIDQVLEGKLSDKTVINQAHTFSNTLFLNNSGQFQEVILPNEAQMAPVYGIVVDDFDKDGNTDIFLAGNMYQREVETTRSDAGKGCLVSYMKDGTMTAKRTSETGISADKDVRSVNKISTGENNLLVIANNNDAMQFYSY